MLRRLLQLARLPAPHFGHQPGAFGEVYYWVQKATLGSSLPLKTFSWRAALKGASLSFGLADECLIVNFQQQKLGQHPAVY